MRGRSPSWHLLTVGAEPALVDLSQMLHQQSQLSCHAALTLYPETHLFWSVPFPYCLSTHHVLLICLFIALELPFSWWSWLWTNRLSSAQLWQRPIAKKQHKHFIRGCDPMAPIGDAPPPPPPVLLQQVEAGQRRSWELGGEMWESWK